MYRADPLSSVAETNTTLQSSYIPININKQTCNLGEEKNIEAQKVVSSYVRLAHIIRSTISLKTTRGTRKKKICLKGFECYEGNKNLRGRKGDPQHSTRSFSS